jgi:hypothetical protein
MKSAIVLFVTLCIVMSVGAVYTPDTNVVVDTGSATASVDVSGQGGVDAQANAANLETNTATQVTTTPTPTLYGGVEPTAVATTTGATAVAAAGGAVVTTGNNGVSAQAGGNVVAVNTPMPTQASPVAVQRVLENRNIDATEISAVSNGATIEIKPGRVSAGDVSVETTENTVTVMINGKKIEITPGATNVMISEGNLSVEAGDVKISNGRIKVGDIEIMTPGEVIVGDLKVTANKVQIRTEEGKVVYNVETARPAKVFWLFPVNVTGEVKINAENGQTIRVQNPWWNFLAW